MGVFKDFFRELWRDYILAPLDNIADKLDTKIGTPVKDALESVIEHLSLIKDGISDIPAKITETKDKLVELIAPLVAIATFLTDVKTDLLSFFDTLKKIPDRIHDAYYIFSFSRAKTLSWLNKQWTASPEHVRANPEIIAAYEATKEALEAEGMLTTSDFALGHVGVGIAKGIRHVTTEAYNNLLPIFEELMAEAELSENSKKHIRDVAASGEFGLNAVISFVLGLTLQPAISTAMEPAWELTRQQTYKALPVRLLPETTILRMMYKGLMSEEEVNDMFAKIGYNESIIEDLKNDYKWIPTIPDVITWAVREAFYENYATEYGLDEEYPSEKMNHYGAKWGIMPEELKYFWRAHWFLPSVGQGYEMLQRKVITDDQLDTLFTTADIMPWWRDKLKAISYTPLGRVDVRRMVRVGTIKTKEECQRRYEDLGYDAENAALMVDFTWKYELEERKALTYSQIMKAYKEMDFPASDAKDLLMLLGYSVTDAEYLVTYWDYEIAVDAETDEINTIFDLFDAGAIGYDDALDRLNKLDFTAARTNRLLAKLEKKREASIKMLSKEDLGKLLTAGVISTSDYKAYMILLNYREEDIDLLVTLAAPKEEM